MQYWALISLAAIGVFHLTYSIVMMMYVGFNYQKLVDEFQKGTLTGGAMLWSFIISIIAVVLFIYYINGQRITITPKLSSI